MRCTSPSTVGFYADGKTLCWSSAKRSKEYASFQIPCGKCLSCRLESARQTAVRCVHEASMHEQNSFITLTYKPEALKSEELRYEEFQAFVKSLRTHIFQTVLDTMYPSAPQAAQRELWRALPKVSRERIMDQTRISYLVTGEYGDKTKRPHWHALIFNWRPNDLVHKYTSERGDKVYVSRILETLWPHGHSELGQVTFESAGYVARYATKKLAHGKDGEHSYEPKPGRSTGHAIGKSWIEKYHADVFNHGRVILDGGIITSVPRYYEKWYKKTHPEKWSDYVTKTKAKIIKDAIEREAVADLAERKVNEKRSGLKGLQTKRNYARNQILKSKISQLKTKM